VVAARKLANWAQEIAAAATEMTSADRLARFADTITDSAAIALMTILTEDESYLLIDAELEECGPDATECPSACARSDPRAARGRLGHALPEGF
jgi:hypothetical protein